MKDTVERLNALLRGELSAVETYKMALDKVKKPQIKSILCDCQGSHTERVAMLTRMVTECGGTPANNSGPWGQFAKVVQGGADVIGEEAAVGSLEEGETQGIKSYKAELDTLDSRAAKIIESQILPGQERTYKIISDLKRDYSKIAK
jgi:demethoxyubiquinone hydroxylase (CLK1/Coq7/Cat5 family)